MKLYTNQDQTAKLIELGFAQPKIHVVVALENNPTVRVSSWRKRDFSIGELIEMLPEDIEDKYNRGVWYFRNITGISVYYSREERMYWTDLYISCLNEELIDNLYDMIIKLKEEGVI